MTNFLIINVAPFLCLMWKRILTLTLPAWTVYSLKTTHLLNSSSVQFQSTCMPIWINGSIPLSEVTVVKGAIMCKLYNPCKGI